MSFAKRTVQDLDCAGKRVLMRVDFNVPVSGGAVTDDTRIVGALPTLRYLISKRARLVLCSHLGRPKGGPDPKYSLKPVRERLARLLRQDVAWADDCVGAEAERAAAADFSSAVAGFCTRYFAIFLSILMAAIFSSAPGGVARQNFP